ncbi:MAG: MBL fold metallo-hydrolase [Sphingomonadales bacterium]|jgi:glyoxylase-like metal-dependent hydrolase (beta-lactamase superfamily II)
MAQPPINAVIIPVTPFQQNCTLLWCTKTNKAAFVDPGGDIDKLLEALEKQSPKLELEKILVTHGHLDHCGAVADLAAQLGVPVEGPHEDDIFWISQLAEHSRNYGFPAAKPFTPDRWLKDGDEVQVGEAKFSVHHCPGHTPGHIVFYQKDAQFALVGDVLFKGSIGRTDFPKSNHDDLINAITKKLWPLGNNVTFVPGHGPISTFGQERASNPFVGDAVMART